MERFLRVALDANRIEENMTILDQLEEEEAKWKQINEKLVISNLIECLTLWDYLDPNVDFEIKTRTLTISK